MEKFIFIFSCILLVKFGSTSYPPLPDYSKQLGSKPKWAVKPTSMFPVKRWFINNKNGKCETFHYKGVGGNFNNFPTQQKCEEHLSFKAEQQLRACRRPVHYGDCKSNKNTVKKWYFSIITSEDGEIEAGTCVQFNYNGCGGNSNIFDSNEECLMACQNDENGVVRHIADKIISTPFPNKFDCKIKHRPGNNTVGRIVADLENKRCVYGAIHVEEKRGFFNSFPECVNTCFGDDTIAACQNPPFQVTPKQTIVSRQQDVQRRYHFDPKDKLCKRYETYINPKKPAVFDPTKNMFDTAELCASYCPAIGHLQPIKAVLICYLPKAGSTYYGSYQMDRYYYHSGAKKCVKFAYSGVGGNMNNFKTKAECEKMCKNDDEDDDSKFLEDGIVTEAEQSKNQTGAEETVKQAEETEEAKKAAAQSKEEEKKEKETPSPNSQ